jgi:hypothetical protein
MMLVAAMTASTIATALIGEQRASAANFRVSGTLGSVRGCDSILSITPTACNPFTLVNALVGGSFEGTYSTNATLPTSGLVSLSNVAITLRNAAGNTVLTYASGSVGNSFLDFSDNAFNFLDLQFPANFNGSGSTVFGRFQQNAAGFGSTSISATGISVSLDPPAPIPTPALLPGLIGMGLAAYQKRKSIA